MRNSAEQKKVAQSFSIINPISGNVGGTKKLKSITFPFSTLIIFTCMLAL